MSSLFSALNILSGLREYTYRGFQQLPLVLAGLSFLFTATTGSIAFLNLLIGMIFVIPLFTYGLNGSFGYLATKFPGWNFTFSRSDVCGMVPPEGKVLSLYDSKTAGTGMVPSYWLMQVCFFFGFVLSNAFESYTASSNCPDSDAVERRKYHATFVLVAVSTLFVVLMAMRFRYMASCELSSLSFRGGPVNIVTDIATSVLLVALFGGMAGGIGYGMYVLARKCGARTGDLLGILSQFLPPGAYRQEPIVCTSE